MRKKNINQIVKNQHDPRIQNFENKLKPHESKLTDFFFILVSTFFSVLQEIKKQPIQRNQLNLTIFFSSKTNQIYSVGVKKLTFSLIFSFCLKVDFCENNYICTAAPPKYESRLCVYYLTSCCKLCCLSSRFVCF